MALLLHITTQAAWDAARAAGDYRPASLATEGFIHCSTPAQAVATADQFFAGRTDLVLLCIDEARVAPLVRYEAPAPVGGASDPRADQLFPHLHGPLPLDAVLRVVAFPCATDGTFTLPVGAGGAGPGAGRPSDGDRRT
ncbi:MAG TPA: DUF952 domain-containing protein [Kofleriaceae bacterium]|nr:DUF952 domain-containing protein [Kofleriaceae bacterium]